MTVVVAVTVEQLLDACGDGGSVAAFCIDTELSPIGGVGSPVNPAVYSGLKYQHDKRWEDSGDEPADVIVIDNVPSQANRLEAALDRNAEAIGLPRLVLDLTSEVFNHLPAHLPRRISSLRFPHRNGDAYLRDSFVDGEPLARTDLGQRILNATADNAGALMSWFPQALLFGFWQSHLGSNRSQAKHARAWTSEIVGWRPATGGDPDSISRGLGTKGDPMNLQDTAKILFDGEDLLAGWEYVEGTKSGKVRGKKTESMSNIGHGQVPFRENELAPMAVSFQRITQVSTCSFAQLRRVRLGDGFTPEQDTAARAVLVALGLHAHYLAFGRGFALRSGTDLVADSMRARFHPGAASAGLSNTGELLDRALRHARAVAVPLDGWERSELVLHPNKGLTKAILGSWPVQDGPASGAG
ncbi:MAG: type I-U CRISPR-associated RAMP protein Csb1/Cas7u [bacterium]|nr:type I-U CRISPR-associated RAMP protein Csb1/Cas7u [bacterium]